MTRADGHWSALDRWAMTRALRHASRALGTTWPNPGVGCVLVRDDVVVGEGRTGTVLDTLPPADAAGPPSAVQEHAEAAALRQAGPAARGATAYVTLAPCTRRSAPGAVSCSSSLVAAGVVRVVVALADPHQRESTATLRAAGLVVEEGLGAEAAAAIHGGFLTRLATGRPRLTGKWAATADGFIAPEPAAQAWISSPEALMLSRRRRRAFDAILIGGGTARIDDPTLLAAGCSRGPRLRLGLDQDGQLCAAAAPLRIVVSGSGILAPAARLLATTDQAPVLLVHGPAADPAGLAQARRAGADLLELADPHDPVALAQALGQRGCNDVLVEGGAAVHRAFLAADCYDRLELYHGDQTWGHGLRAPPWDPSHWRPIAPARSLGGTGWTRWERTGGPGGR